ncbi:DMT family transporter [Seohaeicola zhoushanensis]|uniref:DMT transporter permease n=1 Tax=Seohaeicola zhoushanensis TaxID=1569283 RepID=A0A8J3M6A4_9RHOB|nr:DMT family transporter [Seohaeicola zhoushanensis]GHF46491.1 DMT transporter permease [Seohaeicola zhoushanensis]
MSASLRAALWMIGAIVSFSAMAVSGRELKGVLDTFEIMTFRSIIGLVIVAAMLTFTRRWKDIRTQRIGTHVLRNVAHFTGQNLWLFAVGVAPLAQVFALEFTAPLWVIVLSPLFLGETLTRRRVLCALAGFGGILIVARPGVAELNPGLVAVAIAAVFFAITLIATKRLTRHETIGGIMFWLTSIQLVLGLVVAGHDGHIALPDATALPYVLIVGIGGLVAHFCIATALSIAPASIVVPFDFARLPAIAIVAAMIYGEIPDIWVLVGALVIFAANYVNVLGETRRNRVATAGEAG